MSTAAIVLVMTSLSIEKKIDIFDETWQSYQTDLSEKARLGSALQSSVGYGGLIHDFINYSLRRSDNLKRDIELHIGGATAILEQYSNLVTNNAEILAIDDIRTMLALYYDAFQQIEDMESHEEIMTISFNVVNESNEIGIRGMEVLRNEVLKIQGDRSRLSKSSIVADIKAALGFNGMIHHFKNLLIYQGRPDYDQSLELDLIDKVESSIRKTQRLITDYRLLDISQSEQVSLSDIDATIEQYLQNVGKIHPLALQEIPLLEIDRRIMVDDKPAFRALNILDREINQQISARTHNVSSALLDVNNELRFGKWGNAITILFVMSLVFLLIRTYVIAPIRQLTGNMLSLAVGNFNSQIEGDQLHNELGEMSRSVVVFKRNMVKRRRVEKELEKANTEMQQQLNDIDLLRQKADEQSSQALSLANEMAAARNTVEAALKQAKKNEVLVTTIVDAVQDSIISINVKGIIETFNPGAEAMFGLRSFQAIGKSASILMPEDIGRRHQEYVAQYLRGESHRDQQKGVEQKGQRSDGSTFPISITVSTMHIEDEIKFVAVIRDITEQKMSQAQIEQLAMTDPLTGMANRNRHQDRFSETLNQAKRHQQQFALMVIDLDNFKLVNDNYGHHVGDQLLQYVSAVLYESCRETDTPARIGGDEFVIIVSNINDCSEVSILAQRIIKKLSQPITIENHTIQIGASIGISCYPKNGKDSEGLYRLADSALYASKRSGRNTYRYAEKEHITTSMV